MSNRPASIALVDISYLFKRNWHKPSNVGARLGAAKDTLGDLESLSHNVGHLIVCCDWGPYKRQEVFAEYKANRPEREPEELLQLRYLMEEMKRIGYPIARAQGYEADDVIATLAKRYSEWCQDIRIVGPDKDVSQCITERVRQYIPPTGDREWEERDSAGVLSKFGVYPGRMPMYQALVGDSSDNIPGVDKVGAKTAMEIVNQYHTPTKLAEALPTLSLRSVRNGEGVKASLIANWEKFRLSLQLVTLDTNVPLDAEALLARSVEQPTKEAEDSMAIGNDNDAHPGFDEAMRAYQDKVPELKKAWVEGSWDNADAEPKAARSEDAEEHYEEERRQNEEHVEERPPVRAVPRQSAIITVPSYTQSEYGMVTKDLQPLDLRSAEVLSKWFEKGGLYVKKFANAPQIFTIIAKARELGLPVTVVLDNYHIIEGQPRPSADLIRALAERDPGFEYLMPTELSASRCAWEGKHKRQPRAVSFAYTIEEATAAGLLRGSPYGNWKTRPQDMLSKTAASKLARILWPGATMGLYCMEEMGYDTADLEAA